MSCQHPMAFSRNEEFFSLALDDPASLSEEVRLHLEECALCQKQLAEYTEMNSMLVSSLYRRQCPTSMQLGKYTLHWLRGDERTTIEAHLKVCPLCAEEVEEARRSLI